MTLRERLGDLLKKHGIDIEGKLVSFASRRRGGLNVKQKGEYNLVLVHPDAVDALLKAGRAKEMVSGEARELRGMTRNDLAGHDALTLQAVFDERKFLKSMTRFLSDDDLGALVSAVKIKRYEENGQAGPAFDMRRKLRRRYGERGNRIAVFYSTGLMVEFLGPFLAILEFTPTITEVNRVRRIFDRCVEHMDHAVYVNRLYTGDRVVSEIKYRFEIDNADVVLIFGLGEQVVAKIEGAIPRFVEMEHERQVSKVRYNVKVETFKTPTMPGVIATISRR